MSIVYHNRHVSGVSSMLNSVKESADDLSDTSPSHADLRKAAVQAYEMYGDTLMLRPDFEEANNMYTAMTKYCDRSVMNQWKLPSLSNIRWLSRQFKISISSI